MEESSKVSRRVTRKRGKQREVRVPSGGGREGERKGERRCNPDEVYVLIYP